ncbi:hypothetical protein DFH06DRAFT_1309905 [Mycena polygramma]|nr:hypothetical protein DFH06DRAFT_1309905 [Mycena polygramma]
MPNSPTRCGGTRKVFDATAPASGTIKDRPRRRARRRLDLEKKGRVTRMCHSDHGLGRRQSPAALPAFNSLSTFFVDGSGAPPGRYVGGTCMRQRVWKADAFARNLDRCMRERSYQRMTDKTQEAQRVSRDSKTATHIAGNTTPHVQNKSWQAKKKDSWRQKPRPRVEREHHRYVLNGIHGAAACTHHRVLFKVKVFERSNHGVRPLRQCEVEAQDRRARI